MLAKFDGECPISEQEIIADETEIEKYGGRWCVAKYANREAKMAVAAEMIKQLSQFNDRRSRGLVIYWNRNNSMATFQDIRVHLERKLAQVAHQTA